MKTFNKSKSRRYGGSQKILLYPSIIGTGVVMSQLLAWVYNKIQMGFGTEVAQVGMATGVVVMLLILTSGIRVARKVDQAIQAQRSIFSVANRGRCARFLIRLWGYELTHLEEVEKVEEVDWEAGSGLDDLGLTYTEAMDLVNQTRKRGRRPDFTVERWLPITVKWETRDTTRDAFTLPELISEFLGTNEDGSPAMSEQSYYKTWRPRALAELERRAKVKKAASNKSKS